MSTSQKRLQKLISHLQINPTKSRSQELVLTKVLPSGVGIIILNNPPVNSLPLPVINAIDKAARKFQDDPNIKAVIITGQNRFFSGGADITKLKKAAYSTGTDDVLVSAAHPVLNNIEDGNKPFIAAVNGYALGGGCELAMGCHYRIMSTTASIGLVEATLGLIPGFGGTQRLPRLMGLSEGIYAILTGKQFSAKHANRRGIVDEISTPHQLLKRAETVALEFANNQRTIRRSLYLSDKIPDINVAKQHIAAMKKRFSKIFHMSPAAEYAINAIMGIYKGPKEGLQVEQDTFNAIIKSPSAKGQLHLFFAQRATTKIDIPIKGLKLSRGIKTVAVLGGGTMGSGIAALLVNKGFNVILKEINIKYADIAYKRVYKIIKRFEEKKMLKNNTADNVMKLMKVQTDYNGFGNVDMVIEAVLEDLALKQNIFRELVNVCNNNCILATNTSTINIDKISDGLHLSVKRRIIGLHFFSPAHIMKLLEIIRTNNTSVVVISDMVNISKKLGKIPVIVGNCVGFAANRMFFPYIEAVCFLVEHGVNPYRIDRILENFGMGMGPLKVMDMSGIDIFNYIGKQMRNEYKYCYDNSLLSELVGLNRLGQKTKKGIYIYDNERNVFEDNDGINNIVLYNIGNRKQFKLKFMKNELSDEEIVHICLFPAVNEAFKILSEKYAHKSSDLDIVSVEGYGFPKKCGGLYFWGVNQIGLKQIVSKLQQYANVFSNKDPNLNLSRFFSPCDAMIAASRGY
eukprot:476808_1